MEELFQGVPSSSKIGPWFPSFQYLNNLFYLTVSTEACYFADDTIFFARNKDLNSLIKIAEHDSLLTTEWFLNNNMD